MDFEEILDVSGNVSGTFELTQYQYETIVGDASNIDITFQDILGLYFAGVVAGFLLASLPLVVKKAIKDIRHILTKVSD